MFYMKIKLYFGMEKAIKKSGIGRAFYHQKKALTLNNIEFTTDKNDLDYDILMVAAFAEPKERVFSNIWDVVSEKTPVLYRTYTGMRAILYSPVTEKDTRGFHKEVMLLPTGNTNNTSVLIRKIT